MRRKLFSIAVTLLVATQFAIADVAPPPGYEKVSVSIILQTDDDLSAYRFLFVSGNLVRDVLPVKGQKVTLSSMGGGARYSGGTLYAVPNKAAEKYPKELSPEQMDDLSSSLTREQVPGAIKLIEHGFSREVKKEEATGVTDDAYRLVKTSDGVRAERVNQPPKAVSTPTATPQTAAGGASNIWLMVVVGLLLMSIAGGVGVLLSRTVARQSNEN